MDVKVEIDTQQVVKLVSNVLRQLPYATNSAITRTAKEAVDAGKRELAADLQIRKSFLLGRIRILQYSKVGNLTAIIGIDSKVQGSPLILGFLETGGEKMPSAGDGIAIPITGSPARPSFPQSVPTGLRYKNLAIANREGKKKTFIIPNVGVFQRIAPGKSNDATVEIYTFRPAAKLPLHTHLREAMLAVISQRFATIFSEEFAKEILARAAHT